MTLKIYSGKTAVTVNIDDGVDLYLARNGWKQSGPNPGPAGVWYDVEEKIGAMMLDATDVERAALYKHLALLAAEAAALQDGGHRDHLNPAAHVAVEAQTPTESATRWALLRDLFVSELDAAHYGRRHTRLNLEMTREGLWRGIKPGLAATSLVSTTIRSVDGMGNGTAVTVAPASIAGDAPGLMITSLRPQSQENNTFKICRRVALTTAELNDFQPFLWLAESDIGTPTLVAPSSLANPLNTMHTLPVATVHKHGLGSGTYGWYIDAADYAGDYTVFLIFAGHRAGSEAALTVMLQHGYTLGSTETLATKAVPDQYTNWGVLSLGQITIPASGGAIRGAISTAQYRLMINATAAEAIDVLLAGIVLVPDTPAGFFINPTASSSYRTIVDGEIERSYTVVHSGGALLGGATGLGPYPAIEPGWHNRFYFLPYYDAAGGGSHTLLPNPTVNFDLTIGYIPRFRYLSH